MPDFRLRIRAEKDLESIGRYTEETWGREQRIRYLSMLDEAFHDLADKPKRGRRCDEIREGYRKYSMGKHVIFYRLVKTGRIEIVRVLHERMDIEHRISEI